MNRSILIIICDFLLVTLVAFSNFDADPAAKTPPRMAVAPQPIGGTPDLVGTLKGALEDEQRTRENLTRDLQSTRENLRAQEVAVNEREQKIRQFQENLRKSEEQAKQLDQQRATLAQQAAAAQASLQEVQGRLASASTQNLISQEKLTALQNDLARREKETQALQQKLGDAEKAAQAAAAEKQQIAAQLQVSEAEKRLTREQVAELRSSVVTEKQEKARLQETATVLATNVGALAQKSADLTRELRDNRALAPNAIFSDFLTNRITALFDATRSGLFGRDVKKDKSSQCVLFTDGAQTCALFHVDDTPLMLWNPGTDWNRLGVIMQRGNVAFRGVRLSFLAQDPRVVVVPIGEPQARQYGVKIYKVAADPFRFQDAVIIGANDNYYGECKFEIDASTSSYVKLDRNLLKGLFGKFNPSRGDLVLTRTGELLGIMVNGDYCALLNKVVPTRTIQLGNDVAAQQTGQILSQLYDRIFQMPMKMQ